jgi:hypothetical protein
VADNVTLNRVAGLAGDTIAADDIDSVKHQRVKVQHGADGSATDVSEASPLPTAPPWLLESRGTVTGQSIVHKFGQNDAVSTTFVPVTRGGVYQMPQVASATTLRIKSGGNANDTALGSGAREITLIGTDASGNELTETLATAGASASSVTSGSFIRLYRAYVSKSGTYATQSTGSHSADIVIENGSGGTDWATIHSADLPRGQSEIGVYTIPTGFTGYFLGAFGFSDTAKVTEVIFFHRTGILQTAAPYDAMRTVFEEKLEGGEFTVDPRSPIGPFVGPCDIGFMAKIDAGTAAVEVDFELVLIAD